MRSAARAWSMWEGQTCKLRQDPIEVCVLIRIIVTITVVLTVLAIYSLLIF